jgi:hypothetical protein
MVNMLWRNRVYFNCMSSSRKGEKMCKMTQKSEQLKTQRTDTNMKRLWALVCSDRRLAEELNMGISSEENPRTVGWQVDSPPWQFCYSWCVKGSWVPGQEIQYKNGSSTWFTRLSAWNFRLFQKLKKNSLHGQRFVDIPDIQRNVTLLRGVPEIDFQDCFRQWHHCLTKYIVSQGKYFEGDSSRYCPSKQMLLS